VTQTVDEPDPRSVDVQQAEGTAGGPEAMLDVRRHRDERAWAGAVPLAVEEELDLAFEHVERVGVVWMGVRIDALEVRVVRELERLEMRQLAENSMPAGADTLALAGTGEVRLIHRAGS